MKPDKKNILMLMDYAAPYEGNFIPSIKSLEKLIVKSGGRIYYIFPSKASELDWVAEFIKNDRSAFFIDSTFFSKKIKWNNLVFLKNLVKKHDIHIIHTQFVAQNYSLLFSKLLLPKKTKIIGHFQNHYIPVNNVFKYAKIFTVRHVFDKIIGASESVANSLKQIGYKAEKVSWIHSSLDTEHLEHYTKIKIPDSNQQKVVLMFAWRFYRKGVDIAIDAIKELNKSGSDIVLGLAYACDDEIIKKEIVSYLGYFPTWIKLLGARPDVASLYNSADIFLSSSREEGYTYSVLEAAYCKPMIIVSKIGGHPQDIPDSLVFDLEDPDQLKRALIRIISLSKEETESISVRQKKYVSKKYNLDKWASRVYDQYLSF